MADWRDGPEYAPTAHPFGFAAPTVAPLTAPEEPADAVAVATAGVPQPERYSAPDAMPLDRLEPRPEISRDPAEPFDTTGSTFTGATAWGAVGHAAEGWTPQAPIRLSTPGGSAAQAASPGPDAGPAFPPPTGVAVLPPPQGAPVAPAPAGTTSPWQGVPAGARVVEQLHGLPDQPHPAPRRKQSGVVGLILVLLLFASLVHVVAPFLLVIAVWAGTRLPHEQRSIGMAVNVGTGLAFVAGLFEWALAYGPDRWNSATYAMSGVSMFVFVLVVILAVVTTLISRKRR